VPHERSFDVAPRIEGYFPTSWFRLDSTGVQATALRDYDAAELTIEAGVQIDCLDEVAGWLLVRTAEGRQGWIPVQSAVP